ncbi:TraB/GumN family protein [Marinicella sp. W31]|uniref:TraB/GumN family protein n=1 Tax=Marinicella sp. W31 TaxID=3023713 RepID=UPI003757BC87
MKKIMIMIAILISCQVSAGKDNSLLWKITGKGVEQPSYLFGTIHLICEDNFAFKPKITEALSKVEQLYLEIDMDDDAEMHKLQTGFVLKDKTLYDLIDDDKEEEIDRLLKAQVGMGLKNFKQTRPFAIYSLLAYKAAGCVLPVTYETELIKEVAAEKMPVLGLETVEEQMLMVEKTGMDDANSLLLQLQMHEENVKAFAELVKYYRQEDLIGLEKMMQEQAEELGFSMEYLLDERNRNWVKVMPDIFKDKATFFGVGAGHLMGTNGVINLLKREGYTVEPVH